MKALPEGKSLGWMQAQASWISSHTVRFIGVVRVVIQDGEGFILIKKGKPLFHYFKHGTSELKGHSALDYFNSYPVIEFNLCKYTPDEFAWALKLCNIEDHEPVVSKEPAVAQPVSREHTPPLRPADEPGAKPAGNKRTPDPVVVFPPVQIVEERAVVAQPVSREYNPPSRTPEAPGLQPARDKRIADSGMISSREYTFEEKASVSQPVSREHISPSRPAEAPVAQTVENKRTPGPVVVSAMVHAVEEKPVAPRPVVRDDPDTTIISQIKDLNGIVAISVFNEKSTIIMMGDADDEVLVRIARTMLETARNITPLLPWGPFIHMTIQVPAGNIILAPYHDNYLCMLTTRTINIGHIRRILRDLQQQEAPQRVSRCGADESDIPQQTLKVS
jgi:predicted regulator of Ras-like GTPase activity (Roadblock/LC7/MglB family)